MERNGFSDTESNLNNNSDDALDRQDFKDNIDELQFLVREYRKTEHFRKMLDFISKCNWLAPYNAMLVEMQLPGAFMVMNGSDWKKFNRRPKPNARRLVTLMSFGPVQFMFDYGDTELIPGLEDVPVIKMMEEMDQSLNKTEGDAPDEYFDQLLSNMAQLGIFVDDKFEAANTYGGYIMPYSEAKIKITLTKDTYLIYDSAFIISINRKESNSSKFHTLCHELGHLFCRHQWYDPSERRRGTLSEREFEAETVAWLVCKRLKIKNPSEEYLAGYTQNGEVPICSTDAILKAVKKIEDLMKGPLHIKASPWYEKNKSLKELVNRAMPKKKHPVQMTLPGMENI